MRTVLILLLVLLPLHANQVDPAWAVLIAQERAWNRGDLDGFLTAYVDSDDVIVTSAGKIYRGLDEIETYYRKRFGARLAFSAYKMEHLGDGRVLVIGRWTLGARKGVFSSLMIRTESGWKILHEHTSVEA